MNILDYRALAYRKHLEITGKEVDNILKFSYNIILNNVIIRLYKQNNTLEIFERRLLVVIQSRVSYDLISEVHYYSKSIELEFKYACAYKNIYERILEDSFNQIIRHYKYK